MSTKNFLMVVFYCEEDTLHLTYDELGFMAENVNVLHILQPTVYSY